MSGPCELAKGKGERRRSIEARPSRGVEERPNSGLEEEEKDRKIEALSIGPRVAGKAGPNGSKKELWGGALLVENGP